VPAGGSCQLCLPGALVNYACRRLLSEALLYQINMKYYMKTGITGVGTRDVGTSEFSNLKTWTLEFGITGGFPLISSLCFRKFPKYISSTYFLNNFMENPMLHSKPPLISKKKYYYLMTAKISSILHFFISFVLQKIELGCQIGGFIFQTTKNSRMKKMKIYFLNIYFGFV
jgi:hypothetical protein